MKHRFQWFTYLAAGGLMVISLESALAQPAPKLAPEPTAPVMTQRTKTASANFTKHFKDLGIEGSIVIYDLNRDRTYEHNANRNAQPFPPASTFKILNSLIALETGAVDNELALLTWDGVERTLPGWNRDLNMQTAFKLSAVWFYQVLARRIGHERMHEWVAKVGYGNQAIGSADKIDTFWLDGDLRITPQQQIQFLRRLQRNELPFSEKVVSTVKAIMIMEQTPSYTIRAKTGWHGFGDPKKAQIGWYVGYVEQADNVYFFATNIDIRNENDSKARAEVTRRCLKTLKLL
ncbi:MAG: class D beta-lactamase [Thermosynechococcaceae cyanobacterium]